MVSLYSIPNSITQHGVVTGTHGTLAHKNKTLTNVLNREVRAGSSVGIATEYGLGGPGSNPGGDKIFRPSRSALMTIQSPVHWVPGLSRG